MKKTLLAGGIASVIGLAGIGGVASAQSSTETSSSNPISSLVETLSTKFSLNKDEVQAVFDEHKETMQAERQAEQDEKLAALVTDGKLTQAQVDAIKAKRTELEAEREANKPDRSALDAMTEEERETEREKRKAEMDTKRTELEAWAKEQGIDTQYLRYVMGGGKGGPGGSHGPRS